MRLVMLFGMFLALCSYNAAPQQDTKTSHPKNKSSNHQSNPQPSGTQVIYVSPPSDNGKPKEAPQTPEGRKPPVHFWDRPTITDWIIAFTTSVYALVNVFMLIAIRRQANIAEMNAEAVINSERAWFDIDITSGSVDISNVVVTNYGKLHGIMIDLVLVYAHMTQEEYDKLPTMLDEEDKEWGTRQTTNNGGLLPPGKPVEVMHLQPGAFLASPIRDLDFIDVFYFRVNYETMGQPCYTESVYLLRQTFGATKRFALEAVSGLAHYE